MNRYFTICFFSWLFISVTFDLNLCLAQQCGYTSIHVRGEDGTPQVFTVKAVDPVEHGCYNCQGVIAGDSSNSGALYTHSKAIEYLDVEAASPQNRVFTEVLEVCGKDGADDLPPELCKAARSIHGKCSDVEQLQVTDAELKEYAEMLVEKHLLPMESGNKQVDGHLAYGGLLAALNRVEEALEYFTDLTRSEELSKEPALYYMLGMTNMHQGLEKMKLEESVWNFLKCGNLEHTKWECFEKAAEASYGLGHYGDALDSINKALKINSAARLYFTKGNILFYLGDIIGAEHSFRKCAEIGDFNKIDTLYNLGLVLFHRGKIRNSVEVFRDVIKQQKDHLNAHISLSHAYKELGNYPQALRSIKNALGLSSDHPKALQVQGMLYYYSGQPHLAIEAYEKCLKQDPRNQACLYMKGLCHVSLGHFYEAVKAETKAIVYSNHPALKVSSEYIKAHYLREYSRYLHQNLDGPILKLNVDRDLCDQLKDGWLKNHPFDIQGVCVEQPGLQPDIADVNGMELSNYTEAVQQLLCYAKKLGAEAEINSDGYLPSRRQNLALGLAVIHIAQYLEDIWRKVKPKNSKNVTLPDWQELYNIGVAYYRLVDPELPVFSFQHMPKQIMTNGGYKTDLPFIEGHVINTKAMPYFDLVFRLVKSMIDSYSGSGIISSDAFKTDLKNAETYDDLISVVKRNHLRDQGFVISTQVPSIKDSETNRYDGVMLLLSGSTDGKVDFVINHVTTQARLDAYSQEIKFLMDEIYQKVRKKGLGRVDFDVILNSILSMAYYLYNLMPLTRGSAAVTYSVFVGIVMSLGRELTGRIPPGKLLEMEAILAGAPDAFTVVTQQWLSIQKSNSSVSDYPRVADVFPTVRSTLEALGTSLSGC